MTSAMTAGGICIAALVVLVAAGMILGVEHTLASTGSDRNVVVIGRGARSENSSTLPAEVASLLRAHPGAAAASIEVVASGRAGALSMGLRGVEPAAFDVHESVRIARGRLPASGEVLLGRAAAAQLGGLGPGDSVRVLDRDWTVAGVFEAGGTAFESQIWFEADDLRHALRREQATSAVVRARGDPAALAEALSADPTLKVKALPEADYYAEQNTLSRGMRDFAWILGGVIGLAAALAAMNNMYASMGERRREVATMRALGFAPGSILASFLFEGAILGLAGALAACALSLPLGQVSMSLLDPTRWSSVTFQFRFTPAMFGAVSAMGVALGLVGALAPAWSVVRAPIVETLKEL
jgi:putative ABC transport system permease protein